MVFSENNSISVYYVQQNLDYPNLCRTNQLYYANCKLRQICAYNRLVNILYYIFIINYY